MYKISYWNSDGTGINENEPWVSDPIAEDRLKDSLERMKANGCSVVNIIDIGEVMYFTGEEIRMLYRACTDYGDGLLRIAEGLFGEDPGISGSLSERAAIFRELEGKIEGYIEEIKNQY